MSDKIVIEYTRREAAMGGYYLFAKVKPETVPDALEPCLIYSRASEDRLVRVATLAEMTSIDEDINEYTYLKSSVVSIPAIIASGDTVTVTAKPSLWNEIGYASPKTYRIGARIEVVGLPNVYYLRIDPNVTYPDFFPAYAKDVEFTINVGAGVSGTDGVILRRLDNEGVNNYRVKQQYSLFDTVGDAGNVLTTLESDAQVLIDEYNESLWPSETFEETYE